MEPSPVVRSADANSDIGSVVSKQLTLAAVTRPGSEPRGPMIMCGRLPAGTLALLIVVNLSPQAVYAGTPQPISGTLLKGPAVKAKL